MASHALLDFKGCRPRPRSKADELDDPPTGPRRPNAFRDDCRRAGFSAEAADILDDVRRMMVRNPQCTRAATARLLMLLIPAAEVESQPAHGGLESWQIQKIDRYLRENLERSVRLDELADQAALSRGYFCRAFKQSFGTTPHAYFTQLRLERAQQLES